MLTYSRADLLSLRASAPPVNRRVRKNLFTLRLWRPLRFRFQARADYMSTSTPAVTAQPALSSSSTTTAFSCRSKSIVTACLNARSVRNKSASLVNIIAENNLDVFAVTETWHTGGDDVALRRITPAGYSSINAARVTRTRRDVAAVAGGVVAIIYRSGLKAKKLSFDLKPLSLLLLT